MKLIEVDPRELVPNEANVRRDLGDLSQLAASITHLGILQPLGVVPLDDGRYQLRFGHRRRQVAIDLGLATVPCVVPQTVHEESRMEEAMRILQMLDENTGQPLTVSEEAAGYAQLSLLDWSPAEIAEFRGVAASRVKQALALHRLPQQAKAKTDAGAITVEDALLLSEFDDDPDTMTAILSHNAKGGTGLKHAIDDERRKRDHRRKIERLRGELEAAGVTVIDKPADWPNGTAVDISRLKDAEGRYVRAEQVRDQPAFAAFIDSLSHWQDPHTVVVCLDPQTAGLTRLHTPQQRAETEHAEREAREQQRQAYLAALESAAQVRRQWLAATFGSAAGCKQILADVIREAVLDPASIAGPPDHPLIKKVAGSELALAEKAKLDRLQRLLVGRFLATADDNLDHIGAHLGGYWMPARAQRAAHYLAWLAQHGYTLADAETQLAEALADVVTDEGKDADAHDDVDTAQDDAGEGVSACAADGAADADAAYPEDACAPSGSVSSSP